MAIPDDRAVSTAPLRLPRSLGRAWERVGWSTAVAGAAVAAYLAFSLAYLLDYPPVYSDEPWLLSGPIHIVRTGHDALPMFGEHYNSTLYYDYYVAAFLQLFGIGMAAARLISVLHGLGLIVLVYLVARAVAPRAASIAPVVLVATFPFVEASHYVRPDIVATFYGVLAVWLYLRAREGGRWFLVAAGASAAFSFGLFYQGIWAVVLIGLWTVADRRRIGRGLAWLAGGAVAALVPLLVFVLSDLADYRRFTTKFGGSSIFGGPRNHEALPTAIWHSLQREPDRYLAVERWSHWRLYVVALVALAAVALVAAVATRRFRLAAFMLVPLAAIAAGGANKTSLYFAAAAPALAVLAAALAARSRLALVGTLALTLAFFAGYAANVAHALRPVRTDFEQVAAAYRSAFRFPPGSLVIGQPLVYAYYLQNDALDFRSVHFFTSFRDFELESRRRLQDRLDAVAHARNVYLVYDAPSFYATMKQFDFGGSRLDGLRTLIRTRFKPVAAVHVRGSAYGDFDTTIALYRHTGRARG